MSPSGSDRAEGGEQPRDLDARAIEAALAGLAIGARVVVVGEVGSTMDVAAAMADGGAPDGTVVLADHQTSGRGRFDRTWIDVPGRALLLSILFRPTIPLSDWPTLPRAVGLGARDALAWLVPSSRRLALKWPNDVVVDGAKIAGQLSEARATAGSPASSLVVGLGVNVGQQADELPPGATSLAALGVPVPSRQDLAVRLLRAIAVYVQRADDGDALLEPWRQRLETLGREVTVTDASGSWRGLAVDVAASGALVLTVAGGRRVTVHAGDVTLTGGDPPGPDGPARLG